MKEYQFSALLIDSGCPEDLAFYEMWALTITGEKLTPERLATTIQSQQSMMAVARYCGLRP